MTSEINDLTGNFLNTSPTNSNSEMGKNEFLEMMITQLRYQDPLNPMKSTEFAANLAQFTSLEQLSNLNSSVNIMIDANFLLTQSINNTMTATLIGKDVKLNTQNIEYNGQRSVIIGYDLPVKASSVTIDIYDSFGNIVKTIESSFSQAGNAKLSWDFIDNDGNKVAQGNYRFEVRAEGMDGGDLAVNGYIYGNINGVRFGVNGTTLLVDNVEYMLSEITEIINPTINGGNEKEWPK